MFRKALVVGTACSVAWLAACGDEEARAPTVSPTPSVAQGDGAGLPSGESFVFVRGVDGDGLIVDAAEFLGGEEALQAARADGAIAQDETLPNDFYIRNPERDTRVVPVVDEARFVLIGFDASGGLTEVEVNRATFFGLLRGADASAYYSFIATELPMQVEVEAGSVVGGRQQYLP